MKKNLLLSMMILVFSDVESSENAAIYGGMLAVAGSSLWLALDYASGTGCPAHFSNPSALNLSIAGKIVSFLGATASFGSVVSSSLSLEFLNDNESMTKNEIDLWNTTSGIMFPIGVGCTYWGHKMIQRAIKIESGDPSIPNLVSSEQLIPVAQARVVGSFSEIVDLEAQETKLD